MKKSVKKGKAKKAKKNIKRGAAKGTTHRVSAIENAEERNEDKLEYIGNLIKDGFTSGYDPNYWKLNLEYNGTLEDSDIENIGNMVTQGYVSGEIVSESVIGTGWWNISIEENREEEKFEKGGKNHKHIPDARVEEAFKHYMIAALWSSNDENDEPLDSNYDIADISASTRSAMKRDVKKFMEENYDAIEKSGQTDEQLGHDLWLTRNNHGAGFWDRGYDEEIGKKLTDAAHNLKEFDLYVGDDGKIYSNYKAEGGKAKHVKMGKAKPIKSLEEIDFELPEDYTYIGDIANALRKNGVDAQARYFDQYQGAYIRTPKDKFWVGEMYSTGVKKENKSKYSSSTLSDSEREVVSATRGDYFQLPPNHIFEGYELVLVKHNGEEIKIDNPKISDLPELGEVEHTFQFEEGKETEIIEFVPEKEGDISIVVTKPSGKDYDVTELVEYNIAKFFTGGHVGNIIVNQYEGKTPKQVWEEWDIDQKIHFFTDHRFELPEFRGKETFYKTYTKYVDLPFEELPMNIRDEIGIHIEFGQYKAGGYLSSMHGRDLLSFNKRDYNVNVDLENLEVDVNITRSDSVNQEAINDTGAEWEQHQWGYLIYPENKEQLYSVLDALKVDYTKKLIEENVLSVNAMKTGGMTSWFKRKPKPAPKERTEFRVRLIKDGAVKDEMLLPNKIGAENLKRDYEKIGYKVEIEEVPYQYAAGGKVHHRIKESDLREGGVFGFPNGGKWTIEKKFWVIGSKRIEDNSPEMKTLSADQRMLLERWVDVTDETGKTFEQTIKSALAFLNKWNAVYLGSAKSLAENEAQLGEKYWTKYCAGGAVELSALEMERLDELQKREDADILTKSENAEYEALVEKYRNSKIGSMATGGTTSKKSKKWIAGSIHHKGSLRRKAKEMGLIKGDEKLTYADLDKLEAQGGVWGKRAREARNLMHLHHTGRHHVAKRAGGGRAYGNKITRYKGFDVISHDGHVEIKGYSNMSGTFFQSGDMETIEQAKQVIDLALDEKNISKVATVFPNNANDIHKRIVYFSDNRHNKNLKQDEASVGGVPLIKGQTYRTDSGLGGTFSVRYEGIKDGKHYFVNTTSDFRGTKYYVSDEELATFLAPSFKSGGVTKSKGKKVKKEKKEHFIDKDTPIILALVASTVAEKTIGKVDDATDRKFRSENFNNLSKEEKDRLNNEFEANVETLASYLERRAHSVYNRDTAFRKGVMGAGNSGRDFLYAHMQHWADTWVAQRFGQATYLKYKAFQQS